MAIGGVGAFVMQLIRLSLQEEAADSKHPNTISDRVDVAMFNFAKAYVRMFIKTAQWLGSLVILLLIVGGLGRFAIFTAIHWREIWGP